MKLFILTILCSVQLLNAQDTIKLKEITLKKTVKLKPLLKKIKYNLVNDIDTLATNFKIEQFSSINNSELFNINDTLILKIKSFNNKFTKKYPKHIIKLIEDINNTRFKNYIENSSPIGWISNYPLRKNLNTIELDFIKNNKYYKYNHEKINDSINILNFKSDSTYVGYILYNCKTFKPKRISYESIFPYEFTHSSSQNLNSNLTFKSTWTYLVEKVNIQFIEIKNKLALSKITITEKIENFKYESYDKKGNLIFNDKNDYETIFNLIR